MCTQILRPGVPSSWRSGCLRPSVLPNVGHSNLVVDVIKVVRRFQGFPGRFFLGNYFESASRPQKPQTLVEIASRQVKTTTNQLQSRLRAAEDFQADSAKRSQETLSERTK